MKLSEIQSVKISALKPNEKNKHYFRTETGSYYKNLMDDIKKRGIQVPLVAKRDGTLLAGHNRLLAAKTAGLKKVPVQYIQGKLTEEQEIEYIIKDNLLRRHLSIEERKALYRRLIPDFDERILVKKCPGISVDPRELAEQTGLDARTISYDLTMIRRNKEKAAKAGSDVDIWNEKAVDNFKRQASRMLNIALVEKGRTAQEFLKITRKCLTELESIAATKTTLAEGPRRLK